MREEHCEKSRQDAKSERVSVFLKTATAGKYRSSRKMLRDRSLQLEKIPVFFGKVLEKEIHLLVAFFGAAFFVFLVTIKVNMDGTARMESMTEETEV